MLVKRFSSSLLGVSILLLSVSAFGLGACASSGDDVATEDQMSADMGDMVMGDVADGPSRSLLFKGTGFTPHEGQTVYAALLHEPEDVLVGAIQSAVIAGGAFEVSWDSVLAPGEMYHVHYFADVNGNAVCDAPPADHVWEAMVDPVTADVTIDVTHTLDFVPDACDIF